mmetsp:Transcript_40319/g.59260  ORF Transcript_40319/g.59260 Transcript_40319/m.59260 type:complete len:96 (-) Transcript_40319:1280-1567(-)
MNYFLKFLIKCHFCTNNPNYCSDCSSKSSKFLFKLHALCYLIPHAVYNTSEHKSGENEDKRCAKEGSTNGCNEAQIRQFHGKSRDYSKGANRQLV